MKPFYATNNRSEYYRDHTIAVDCVEIQLRNDPLYLTTGGFDVTFDSPTAPTSGEHTYTAQGNFIGFSSMSEDIDVKVGKFSITLSGVDNDYFSKFFNKNPEGARVVIYKAFLNFGPTGTDPLSLVADPILIYDGQIYNFSVQETQETCQISLDCSSLFADFERVNGRKSNNWSNWLFQGAQYDKCFEKAGWVGQTEFKWGRL